MFSGSDTIDYPTQWALNPSAYQNMSNDQVDWGALAQQWIHMKETCPAQPVPPAPPPPPPIAAIPSTAGIEGGEAPMEMEGEMEAPPAPSVSQQQWTNASSNPPTGNWDNQSWDSWGNWGWQQNSEPVTKQPLLPEPTYSGYSTGESNFSGYSGGGQSSGTYGSSGYWSGDRGLDGGNRSVRPPHPPPPSSRHQQMPRRNQRPPLLAHPQQELVEAPDTTQTIDAAKRRQLPAWIREGLEKMEREKQKQMDRERERKERDEYLRLKKIEDEKALKNAQPDDGIPRPPAKSKFDSDSDDSETEVKVKVEKVDRETKEVLAPPPLLKRSEEEIMQDVMLCVRRTLTEILLDVTTEQILSICQEEVARIRSQTQASRGASLAGKSQALSAIGGQLGLGIYGDSSGDSESESDSTGRSTPGGKKRSGSHDVTDGQLQENIRRRKSEFEKTSREIEARLAAEEEALLRKSSVGRSRVGNSVPTHGDGDSSGSDGEDTPSENRNEPSVATQRDPRDRTPPLERQDKSKRSNTESKIRHSTEKKDKNDASRKQSRRDVKKSEKSSRDKKRRDKRDKSNSSSSSSDSSASSESESVNNKSDDSESKQSNSVASVSSESSSSSSSRSSNSPPRKKGSKKKKKRTSSNDSSKRDKKESRKSKSNNGKKVKSSKNSEKVYSKFDHDEDTTQSSSKRPRDYYEHKSERSLRESQFSSRDSYARTPDRKVSAKSRYNERSRSRSLDRASSRYESRKYSSYRTEERSRDRSREDRGRSREYRDRSRDRRGNSRDRRGRSRNRDDRRDGGRREGRSYRY